MVDDSLVSVCLVGFLRHPGLDLESETLNLILQQSVETHFISNAFLNLFDGWLRSSSVVFGLSVGLKIVNRVQLFLFFLH